MKPLDALVIGGGPAGAACAVLLARAGRSVALCEQERSSRIKVCGELVSAAGLELLARLGVAVPDAHHDVRRLELWLRSGRAAAAMPRSPGGVGYPRAFPRERLDRQLLLLAAREGAAVLRPAKALSLERRDDGFACTAAERRGAPPFELRARCVIDASGTRRPAGSRGGADLVALKCRLANVRLSADTIALVPLPGGYAGLLRIDGGDTTFAACVRRDALAEARAKAGGVAGEAFLRSALRCVPELEQALAGARRTSPWLACGLQPGFRPLYRNGVFAAGNAGGEAHPVVGEGITMALEAAALLCPPLADALGGAFSEREARQVAELYEKRWRRRLGARLRASAGLAKLSMRAAATPAGGALLARAPGLLSLAARLGGKTAPLSS